MEDKYRLVAREKYPLTFFVHEHELQYIDQVEMYEFVPVEQRAWRPGRPCPRNPSPMALASAAHTSPKRESAGAPALAGIAASAGVRALAGFLAKMEWQDRM